MYRMIMNCFMHKSSSDEYCCCVKHCVFQIMVPVTLVITGRPMTKQDTVLASRDFWIDILNKQNQAFKDVGVNNQHPFLCNSRKKVQSRRS